MSGSSLDLPPLYTSFTLPHANTLPLYSECPHAHERRVLQSEPSSPMVPDPFHTRQMVYRSDHLEVDLGQFPGAFIHPTYGFNSVIEGSVKFAKTCTYVSSVTVRVSFPPWRIHPAYCPSLTVTDAVLSSKASSQQLHLNTLLPPCQA